MKNNSIFGLLLLIAMIVLLFILLKKGSLEGLRGARGSGGGIRAVSRGAGRGAGMGRGGGRRGGRGRHHRGRRHRRGRRGYGYGHSPYYSWGYYPWYNYDLPYYYDDNCEETQTAKYRSCISSGTDKDKCAQALSDNMAAYCGQ